MENHDAHTTLISSEEFEFFNPSQIELLTRYFRNFDIHVVVYLRRQDEFLISEYKQNLSMPTTRYTKDIMSFFVEKNMSRRLNFYALLKRWESKTQSVKLHVGLYDRDELEGGDVIRDFCKTVNIQDDLSFEQPNPTQSNVSYSNLTSEVLRRLNHRQDLDPDKLNTILDSFSRYSRINTQDISLLSTALRKSILRRN